MIGLAEIVWQWRRADRHAAQEMHQREHVEATVLRLEMEQADTLLARSGNGARLDRFGAGRRGPARSRGQAGQGRSPPSPLSAPSHKTPYFESWRAVVAVRGAKPPFSASEAPGPSTAATGCSPYKAPGWRVAVPVEASVAGAVSGRPGRGPAAAKQGGVHPVPFGNFSRSAQKISMGAGGCRP
jgi:hypothetical protein